MKEIESFLSYLKNEKNYSIHTIKSYENDIRQFKIFINSHLGMSLWSGVRHPHVRSWVVYLMQDNYTSKSINRKLSSLKSFFKYLNKTDQVDHNPTNKIISPKIGKRLPEFVREENMNKPSGDDPGMDDFSTFRDHLIIEILYNTGLRRMELIQLKDTDINFERREMKVLGKGNKERIIPCSPKFLDLLMKYLELKKEHFEFADEFLIVTDKGKKVYPKYIYSKVKCYLSQVTTIKKKSPHILRHTFATHMAGNGADLNAIKEIMGHASLAATEIYMHNTVDKLKKIYAKAHPKGEMR